MLLKSCSRKIDNWISVSIWMDPFPDEKRAREQSIEVPFDELFVDVGGRMAPGPSPSHIYTAGSYLSELRGFGMSTKYVRCCEDERGCTYTEGGRPLFLFLRRQERVADPSASGEKLDSFPTGLASTRSTTTTKLAHGLNGRNLVRSCWVAGRQEHRPRMAA